MSPPNILTDEIYNKMIEYYGYKDIDYEYITVLANYKKGGLKLSQEEANFFISPFIIYPLCIQRYILLKRKVTLQCLIHSFLRFVQVTSLIQYTSLPHYQF